MSIRKTLTLTALTLTMTLSGAAVFAQSATRGDAGGYGQEEPGGGGGHGGASDLAGHAGRGEAHGVIHDSDAQLDVWVTNCNDAGGGMSTDETGNYTCTGADGNEIEDY